MSITDSHNLNSDSHNLRVHEQFGLHSHFPGGGMQNRYALNYCTGCSLTHHCYSQRFVTTAKRCLNNIQGSQKSGWAHSFYVILSDSSPVVLYCCVELSLLSRNEPCLSEVRHGTVPRGQRPRLPYASTMMTLSTYSKPCPSAGAGVFLRTRGWVLRAGWKEALAGKKVLAGPWEGRTSWVAAGTRKAAEKVQNPAG